MNKHFIKYTIGIVLKIEAVLLLVPILVALIYQEKQGFCYLYVALLCLFFGIVLSRKKPEDTVFFLKEGCVMTVLSWIVLSFFGGLPFFFTGEMNASFIDSMFESVSGFTTTGATILSSVENLSKCTQMWRSLSHWIGGMGVLVFLLAVIPLSGGSNINIMRAESTGTSVDKLSPKIRGTARILYSIYILLTLLEVILLLVGHTPLFDSLNIAFSTTGTGGFGIKNDSLASYSAYVQWVVIIFMVLSALKFDFYFFLFVKHTKRAFSEEILVCLLIFAVSTGLIIFDLFKTGYTGNCFRDAALASSSIMSTTGFTTADFNLWPDLSKTILLILMFIGGCTGCTAGGFKVSRIIILFKSIRREVTSYLSPHTVKKIKMDGKILDEEVIRTVNAYLSVYTILFVLSLIVISAAEYDFVTNVTSVVATFNNVGPGLELVGPTGNYGFHPTLSKIVLIFDMLAGRLEIFPLIAFFRWDTWRHLLPNRWMVKKYDSR